MELDMYDDDRKLAMEYNGIQHYDFPNPFHYGRELQLFDVLDEAGVDGGDDLPAST